MVISCSICSIWSVVEASVSSPGTTMDAGSGFGFHRGGLGVILARFGEDIIRQDGAQRYTFWDRMDSVVL